MVFIRSIFCLLIWKLSMVAAATKTASSSSMMESCISQGFDPTNLSCDTCVLLRSTDYHLQCLDCCQSYKTLDSKTSRYKSAILVHAAGGNEEIDNFVREELEQVQEQKEGFTVRKSSSSSSPYGGMIFGMSPSVLYFFKDQVPASLPTKSLPEQAQEEIYLRGWSKDDLKDMIQTLLPDKAENNEAVSTARV
jgi:hypothetical protein